MEKLDQLLCNPELYNNPDEIIELSKKRENIQMELDFLYNNWIKLTEN